jgi:hypothetical protein
MLDTVNFWLGSVDLMGRNPFEALRYLSDITERQNDRAGYSCSGNIGEYVVNIGKAGISLKGSLAKSLYGDNIHTLTRQNTQLAIEALSDALNLDIRKASVTRLDVSTVIPSKRPPADYLPYLGDKPYFHRVLSAADTLYYNNVSST